MLRHALRRLLWTLPTLLGVSMVSFFLLSHVPDPIDDPAVAAQLSPADVARVRRERFLDLPRFVNLAPRDVAQRADEALRAVVAGEAAADEGARELARLGGAALPHVLPRLDALPPERRGAVARALAPVARRMGIDTEGEAADPARAVAFWARFWDDRGVEFRRASVRSAVARLTRYGSASRAAELVELDTFALDDVLAALEHPYDAASAARARALVDVAAHVTGRDDRIAPGDDLAAARACVERWHAFWEVYRSDYTALSGVSRLTAMALETRYGKWALSAVTHRLGRRGGEEPVLDELVRRAPLTLSIVFGAIGLGYAAGIALGALGAASRKWRLDATIAAAVLLVYAIPTAALAVLARRLTGASGPRIAAATIVLALALVAAPARQQSAALAEALSRDHVRAAFARGAGRARAVLVHGLRNALLPAVTLAALEGPMALGGAFVVERVFSLYGLGEATIQAVQHRDLGWLMALSIAAAGVAAIFVMLTDLAYAALDPRLASVILARKSRW
jgi:peptide/nickel transport system permease protein